MDSGDSKQSDKLVFRSEQIRDTKAKEKVNHFVNLEKRAERAAKRKAALERLKKAKGKILTVAGIAVVIVVITVGLSPIFRKQASFREADNITDDTEEYIKYLEERKEHPEDLPKEGSVDDTLDHDGENFDTIYERLTNYLTSEDKTTNNDEKNLELAKSLFDLSKSFNNNSIYLRTAETLKDVYGRMRTDENKAKLGMILAELYYTCGQQAEGYDYFAEAVKLYPSLGDIDYYETMTSTFLDMWLEYQGMEG